MINKEDKEYSENLHNLLENKSFRNLEIKRIDNTCYLIIHVEKNSHVLTNSNGKQKQFRHAWQVKEWLEEKYDISTSSISYSEQKL